VLCYSILVACKVFLAGAVFKAVIRVPSAPRVHWRSLPVLLFVHDPFNVVSSCAKTAIAYEAAQTRKIQMEQMAKTSIPPQIRI